MTSHRKNGRSAPRHGETYSYKNASNLTYRRTRELGYFWLRWLGLLVSASTWSIRCMASTELSHRSSKLASRYCAYSGLFVQKRYQLRLFRGAPYQTLWSSDFRGRRRRDKRIPVIVVVVADLDAPARASRSRIDVTLRISVMYRTRTPLVVASMNTRAACAEESTGMPPSDDECDTHSRRS